MMISFSTVRLARMTSAMLDVCVMVVREPVARVSDCDGATEALRRTSPDAVGRVDAEQHADVGCGRIAGERDRARTRASKGPVNGRSTGHERLLKRPAGETRRA